MAVSQRPRWTQKTPNPGKRLFALGFLCVLLSGLCGTHAVHSQERGIAIVLPAGTGDSGYVASVGKRFSRMLSSLGFAAETLDAAALSEAALKPHKLVVLPMNPNVPLETARLLNGFVSAGGKLFVTYNLAHTVAPLLGLQEMDWLKAEPLGQFSAIRLDAPEIANLPASVRQLSWNITLAAPTTPRTKAIGYWQDAAGDSTGLPALFLGEAGAFFSHIFLPDDIENKRWLLAALIGHLVPPFQQTLAKKAVDEMTAIGHTDTINALTTFVERAGHPEARRSLETGKTLMEQARRAYREGAYTQAVTTARNCRETLADAYYRSHTSRETEGRAVWNHSGLGAYPGDWDRSAKELADAGVNMLFPNMAWAGVAHYPSRLLPQSATFKRYGDQLAACAEAARKHGLQLHVWKITWNLEGAPQTFVDELRNAARTQVSATGEPLNWLCPSHPKNVLLELESILEIVTNYDVDGIHLDYIRYPGRHGCYCTGCRERFVQATRLQIAEWPTDVLPDTGAHRAAYTTWRVQQITRLVRLVSKRLAETAPGTALSAAVFGGYPGCVTSIGQDWIAWAKAGYVDFLCPMNYAEATDYFTRLLVNQLALMPEGVPLYTGIGATATNSLLTPDGVVAQIHHARQLGAAGWTIFDYSLDIADTVLPALKLGVTSTESTPPH